MQAPVQSELTASQLAQKVLDKLDEAPTSWFHIKTIIIAVLYHLSESALMSLLLIACFLRVWASFVTRMIYQNHWPCVLSRSALPEPRLLRSTGLAFTMRVALYTRLICPWSHASKH